MKWPLWLYRVVPYLGRRQAEADLQEELRLHLELDRERQRDAGFAEDVADRAAQRKLGNGALIRERTRDIWGLRHYEHHRGRETGIAPQATEGVAQIPPQVVDCPDGDAPVRVAPAVSRSAIAPRRRL